MRALLNPLRDINGMPPTAYCPICGGEIYDPDCIMPDGLCGVCYEEKEKDDD